MVLFSLSVTGMNQGVMISNRHGRTQCASSEIPGEGGSEESETRRRRSRQADESEEDRKCCSKCVCKPIDADTIDIYARAVFPFTFAVVNVIYWVAYTMFSPMVFLYLSTVIPSIWFLELSLLQSKLPVNSSSGPELQLLAGIPITAGIVALDPENWVAGLEQTMLIVLVLGRWLMPKGDMSRDQLSQLLMVYVGLGADILDIFDTFKEPEVKTNRVVVIVGLTLFSWALMQFPLVLTQTRLQKDEHPKKNVGGLICCPATPSSLASCCSSEVWSLLLTVGLQDGPFLLYRLYLMVQEQVLNQLMIFFTCKNILIVLLELYRIFVVQCELQSREVGLRKCDGLVACCRNEESRVEEQKQAQVNRDKRRDPSCHTDTERMDEMVQDQSSDGCDQA
ncbi:unnamed protein product [Lampetra planeri]